MEVMRSQVSRISEMRFSVNDERTRDEIERLTETAAAHLRTLVIAEATGSYEMHPLAHQFPSLEVLCISGYSLLKKVHCHNLRTLNIARATFDSDEGFQSLVALMQDCPRLNDASFQDVIIDIGTDDIETTGLLLDTSLRKISFVNTTEVATLLTSLGIPPGATLVMRDVFGDILPDDLDSLGDLVDIGTADVFVGHGYLRVMITEGETKLSTEWTHRLDVSLKTFTDLLEYIPALRIHTEEGRSGKHVRGERFLSADRIWDRVLEEAEKMGIDCEIVEDEDED